MSFAEDLVKKLQAKYQEHNLVIRADYKIGKDIVCNLIDYDDEWSTLAFIGVTLPIPDELKLSIRSVSIDVNALPDKSHTYRVKPDRHVKLEITGDYSVEELRDAVKIAEEAGYKVTSTVEEEDTVFIIGRRTRDPRI